jgi:N-acetylglucosaminyldiphosphoundecaprenol N-acetyl-beta-D-mannosaminyltransferase
MRTFLDNANIVLIDGFPIYLLARAGDVGRATTWKRSMRVGTLDWVPHISRLERLRRLAIVGSTAKSNEGAVARLRELLPDVETLGLPGECWNNDKADAVIEKLHEFQPNLVLVGLGMPRQEHFLAKHAADLPPAVYATIGGAIDQLSGYQRPAPRALGRLGLEWLWRLVSEPRRLAHRYLVEPWTLAAIVLRRMFSWGRQTTQNGSR